MQIRTTPHPGVALVIGAALALSGCSASATDLPAESSALPDGMTVAVYQSRSDVASGQLEVQIANLSDDDVTITAVEFSAPQFAEPAVWQKDSTVVGAGRTVDLPVLLPGAVCDENAPAPTVRLTWAVDGNIRSSDVVPTDERGRLEELRADGCFAGAVDSIASLSLETPPRPVTVDGVAAAELDLTVTPGTGSGGSLTIRSLSGTTLFTFIDRMTGLTTTSLDLGAVVAGGTTSVVTVILVPTRCDPHAIAEDKQGTIFVFDVDARPQDGPAVSGTISVAAPAQLTPELIAFVGEACGSAG